MPVFIELARHLSGAVRNERKDYSQARSSEWKLGGVPFIQPYLLAVVALGQGLHAHHAKSRFSFPIVTACPRFQSRTIFN